MQRMRELGWVDGRTVAIEVRWAEGRRERFAEIAAEFMRLRVDVIVTAGSAIPTIETVTSSTPIVFALEKATPAAPSCGHRDPGPFCYPTIAKGPVSASLALSPGRGFCWFLQEAPTRTFGGLPPF
jgi:hypothetical protein